MFFQNAHLGRNGWWRWLLTIAATLLAFLLGHGPFLAFVTAEAERLGVSPEAFFSAPFPAAADRNLFLFFGLLPHAFAFAALLVCIAVLHRKSVRAVITGRRRFDWRRVATGFGIASGFLLLGSFPFLPADSYAWQFDPAGFWPLLLIALVLIPIQTTAEEVFFRGYLMQGVSLVSRNKLLPLILVTLLFAGVHFGNPEFSADYSAGPWIYLSISLLLGLVTVMDDGLELPIGIHAANNIFLTVVLSYRDGSFITNSLFVTSMDAMMWLSPYLDIATSVLLLLLLSGVYGWRLSSLVAPVAPRAAGEAP
jgi:hypothetical protein